MYACRHVYALLWGHDWLHNKHWLLWIPKSSQKGLVHNLTLSKKTHYMLNSHQPQWDSQLCLLCWTGKRLFIFNHMQIASHLNLTSKKLLTTLVSRKPEEEDLRMISNSWNTRGCKRYILNPVSDLHERKDLTGLAWSRASPRKWMVKA